MTRKLCSNLGTNLASTPDPSPLDVVLDSWDRKNAILLNRLRAIPQGELESRAVSGSPCVAEMFTLIAYVRLIFVSDDAPRFAGGVPENDWLFEAEPERIAQVMDESAAAVRDAVQNAVEKGDEMRSPIGNKETGPVTWGVWMRKNDRAESSLRPGDPVRAAGSSLRWWP